MIKIIFFDIDWTIYDHKVKSFNMKSLRAIKKAQKLGVKIFICTSRSYHSVETLGLFAYLNPDGLITSNGSLVIIDDEIVRLEKIASEDMIKTIEVIKSHHLTMEYVCPKNVYLVAPKNDYVDKLFAVYYEDMPEVKDYEGEDVVTCLLFAPREYEDILIKELPSKIKYYRFDDYGVDLSSASYKKGDGVKTVLNYFGYRKDEAMAFGDDLADITMFNEVKFSIAMGNAKKEVKDSSFYVCENIEEDGVYNTLKKFDLI